MTNEVIHGNNAMTATKAAERNKSGVIPAESDGNKPQIDEDAQAELLHGWYIECCEYYADSFRRAPTIGIRRDIAMTIREGMTAECLNAIMDETQSAYHPSWYYCMAIVRRCQNEGIRTLDDWQRDRRRRMSERNPALRFNERAYQDGDFGKDFFRGARSSGWHNPALDYEQRDWAKEYKDEDFYVDLSQFTEDSGKEAQS